jgi:hypothetical protein
MFTVIICDKHVIEDCRRKYHIYLNPFYDSESFVFCEWNSRAQSFDEAVPALRELIVHKSEWRAIIINDASTWGGSEYVDKRNPFDYVDFSRPQVNYSDFSSITANRTRQEEQIKKALSNPLLRLSVWLCGAPMLTSPVLCYKDNKQLFDYGYEEYTKALDELGLRACDVEIDRYKEQRFNALNENFELRGELFTPPSSVIAISERTKNMDEELAQLAWSSHTEFYYTRFYTDNLYPDKLRYVLCDIPAIKGRRNEKIYFNFLTTMMILATQEEPQGALRSNRVYKIDMEIDVDRVRVLCNDYNSKLRATLSKIEDISRKLVRASHEPVDEDTAEDCFERTVEVPIEAISPENRRSLFAKYSKIGLSTDCPADEQEIWNNQFHDITKHFIRFLREPRRVVKTAVKGTFRALNSIDDDRALRLNEFQRENVESTLEEEERNMIATDTTRLFDTEMYNDKMRESAKELNRSISHRMTKKKTVLTGIFSALVYLIGFLPLLFVNFNTTESFLFSLAITGIVLGIFLIIGFVYILIMRKRLIDRFISFNMTMSGIVKEIEEGVGAFSKYLSHACNVMREFSVLNRTESKNRHTQHILANHKAVIEEKIKEVNELFSGYIDTESLDISNEAEPYEYDFTLYRDYDYYMPYSSSGKTVDYMQSGNEIFIPVDYVESITLIREELYD